MQKANEKQRPGRDQGNAIENETCDVACHEEAESRKAESVDDESAEGVVTEEESTLAENFPDGGEPAGKKF